MKKNNPEIVSQLEELEEKVNELLVSICEIAEEHDIKYSIMRVIGVDAGQGQAKVQSAAIGDKDLLLASIIGVANSDEQFLTLLHSAYMNYLKLQAPKEQLLQMLSHLEEVVHQRVRTSSGTSNIFPMGRGGDA